jgi:hypothetical protein
MNLKKLLNTFFILSALLSLSAPVYASNQTPAQSVRTTPDYECDDCRSNISPQSLNLSSQEQYLLLRLKIQKDLHDDILKSAQWWFGAIGLLAVFIGFFGVRALVRDSLAAELKDLIRNSAEAQTAANQGKEAVKELRNEASNYRNLVETLTETATKVDEQFKQLGSKIESEGTRTEAAAELKIKALQNQITELNLVIQKLAADSQKNQTVLKEYAKKMEAAQESAASSQATFEANSKIRVFIVGHEEKTDSKMISYAIQNELAKNGFKVDFGKWAGNESIRNLINIQYNTNLSEKGEEIRTIIQNMLSKKKSLFKINNVTESSRKMPGWDIGIFIQ